MKRVLVIDGGGVKGIIPLSIIKEIEHKTKKPIYKTFDLIMGTSVGSIIGGVLAADAMSSPVFLEEMIDILPKIFKFNIRVPIIQPKYSTKPLDKKISEAIGESTLMKQCKTKFVCTSVNMVDGRTHFFKSWEEKDGNLNLTKAIKRSYAVPYYFGPVIDNIEKNVWLDGGIGSFNSPVMQSFIEVNRLGWLYKEKIHILSLGCGQRDYGIPFNKAKRYKNIRQIYYYANPVDGGLARLQSTMDHNEAIHKIAEYTDNFSFQRIEEYDIPKNIDKLDCAKYRYLYKRIGEGLSDKVDFSKLIDN